MMLDVLVLSQCYGRSNFKSGCAFSGQDTDQQRTQFNLAFFSNILYYKQGYN